MNVVNLLDCSSNGKCQNQLLTSHLLRIFACAISGISSSTVGTGWILRFSARFNCCGSIQTRSLPFGLCTISIGDTQSVGSVTGAITPRDSKRVNSSFNGSLIATGTRLTEHCVGRTNGSNSRWRSPFKHPSSRLNTGGYFSRNCERSSPHRQKAIAPVLSMFLWRMVKNSSSSAATTPIRDAVPFRSTWNFCWYSWPFAKFVSFSSQDPSVSACAPL